MNKIEITKLDHSGRGIGYLDGKIIFVSNALPTEIVDVVVTNSKKKYLEGTVLNYINKATNRIDAPCPYYELCGGCQLMHISYEDQLKYKENKVKEIINKYTNISEDKVRSIIPTTSFYYRNKVTLQVKEKIGYYQKKSYDIVNIDHCMIASEKINEVILKLNSMDLKNITKIVIKEAREEVMVVLELSSAIDNNIFKDAFKDVNIITYFNGEYETISGNNHIVEQLGEYQFIISPDSFFQVNTSGAINLYNQVLKYANLTKEETVLDLYCGTGSIGIYLSKEAKKVIGVELNTQAINDALLNKELNKINSIDFYQGDAGIILSELNMKADLIIVDPPRSGFNKQTIDELLKQQAKKIVYVSCDPVTLARDLNELARDYEIIELTPVDMFPNTYHVESIVRLEKQ